MNLDPKTKQWIKYLIYGVIFAGGCYLIYNTFKNKTEYTEPEVIEYNG